MITIKPSVLKGSINVQSSKSVIHRAFICAALAEGQSQIKNVTYSNDVIATLKALRDLGYCEYSSKNDVVSITGGLKCIPKNCINCEESGTTLRVLLPLGVIGKKVCFITKGRLSSRPMEPFKLLFNEKNILFIKEGDNFIIDGTFEPGDFHISGNISSQFISGLLFKLPLLNGNSTIKITTDIESKPYINLTRHYQSLFNVHSSWNGPNIEVNGNQTYTAASIYAEGDYSHAAFFAVAGALGGDIYLKGLLPNSVQGDKEILTLLQCMGAKVTSFEMEVNIKGNLSKPMDINASDIPDLVPILAVAACGVNGVTKIYNAGRLRFKESDRLNAITSELGKIGAQIFENEDSLVIEGKGFLNGGMVSAHNDHRIVMALTIASCIAKNDIIIDFPEAVYKSSPDFFKQFKSLGGKID